MLLRQVADLLRRAERSSVTIGDGAVWADEEGLRWTRDLQRRAQHDIGIR